MNQLLINIAKRLVCKAIKLNTDDYNLEIAYKCINNKSTIIVTIFNESLDNKSYNFYDDSIYSNKHYIEQYKTILKKTSSKEL